MKRLCLIIPCYQNQENIPVTWKVLRTVEKKFPRNISVHYIFIDDASTDHTLGALQTIKNSFPKKITIIKLSINVGSNKASLAGLTKARGDCFVILSADLQDPPKLIPRMAAYWQKGAQLVLATRNIREDDNLFSRLFHFLMRHIAFPNAPKGGFDLCLFDKDIRDKLTKITHETLFIPYFLLSLKSPYVAIPYTRKKREIGESTWTLRKKVSAATSALKMAIKLRARAQKAW